MCMTPLRQTLQKMQKNEDGGQVTMRIPRTSATHFQSGDFFFAASKFIFPISKICSCNLKTALS